MQTDRQTRWYTAIKDNVDSPNGMVASQVQITQNCFTNVPDYETKVYSYVTHRECYIHESYAFYSTQSLNVTRCGQCLELTGSTQNPFKCVVTGFFKEKEENNLTDVDLKSVVFLSNANYNYIATNIHSSFNHASQVSLRVIGCTSEVIPVLYIINTFFTIDRKMSTVQVVNTDVLHKIMIVDFEEFKMNTDGTYTIPARSNINIQLVGINNVKIGFLGVNSLDVNHSFYAETQFPVEAPPNNCFFSPETQVLSDWTVNPALISPVRRFFLWKFYLANKTSTFNFDTTVRNVVIPDYFNSKLGIAYPTAFKFGQTMKKLELMLKFSKKNYSIKKWVLLLTEYSEIAGKINTTICAPEPNETQINDTHVLITLNFNNDECFRYANLVLCSVETGEGTSLTIVESAFTKRDETVFTECGIESADCSKYSCTMNATKYPEIGFKPGCEPNCGRCLFGYECSNKGICEKVVSSNKRSGSTSVGIVLCVLIVICFF
ncbi:hypothetical protein EIN_064470 [Entamoeba invadens IP1]|uniref:Uncharacterized protein n=1 Tax=Entamoeba invadens IP1 TaxID=370355 RepID=A0A0A1TV70_ENTIV|nr:hypothetical protein EIN_064470 [Entamoeba invadens IP1]ELP84222.1 hypothetical protein EIN_064470 [Entamoeba invadens IP1]|eukprot:XP_004183568.1 hypothetical protein EIN_064470 [Entamoeba invadens IP1]